MNRALAFILAAWIAIIPAVALADGVSAPIAVGPIGQSTGAVKFAPVSGSSPATYNYGAAFATDSAGFVSTYTTGALNIGTATATRFIVVGVEAYLGGAAGSFTAVTVGSTSLSHIVSNGNTVAPAELWGGVVGVGEGSSATIAVTTSATMQFVAGGIGVFDNLTSNIPTTTATGDYNGASPCVTSSALTIPVSPGFGWVFASVFSQANANTWSAPFSSDGTALGATNNKAMVAHATTAGAATPTVTCAAFTGMGLVSGTWH